MTTNNELCSSYIDTSNNIREVKHTVIFTEVEKRELEERIVEDLYRIFAQ